MKRNGFSMLELVVVMLIMGSLAGIAISKMGSSDQGAIKASIKSDLRNSIRGMNSCYRETLNFHTCLPTTNPVTYGTADRGRKLGGTIYVGITTQGNEIKFDTSRTDPKYFQISRYNSSLDGHIKYDSLNDSGISDFIDGGHPF